jgi:hypothetical protein
MNRNLVRASAIAALALTATTYVWGQTAPAAPAGQGQTPPPAPGQIQNPQPPAGQANLIPGGINQMPWFSNPQLRQELKLNDQQHNDLNKAHNNAYTSYQTGIKGLDKLPDAQRQQQMNTLHQSFYKDFSNAAQNVLTDPAQRQRFDQLGLQYRGYGVFSEPTVAAQLKLTAEQQQQLSQLHQNWHTQMSKISPQYQNNRDQALKQYSELQGTSAKQLNSILTPGQQTMWQQMTGTPYSFHPDIYFRPGSTVPPGKGGI